MVVCYDSPEKWIYQFPETQSSDNRAREVIPVGDLSSSIALLPPQAGIAASASMIFWTSALRGPSSARSPSPKHRPQTTACRDTSKCTLLVWLPQQLFLSTVSCLPVPSLDMSLVRLSKTPLFLVWMDQSSFSLGTPKHSTHGPQILTISVPVGCLVLLMCPL